MVDIRFIHGAHQDIGPRQYDHIITDPPYNAHTHKNQTSHTAGKGVRKIAVPFSHMDPEEVVRDIRLADRWNLFFCALEDLGEYRKHLGASWVRSGIYRKQRAMPQLSGDRPANSCEGISIAHGSAKKRWNAGGKHAFWEAMPERRRETMHPTGKPVELCKRLVEMFTDPGDTIYDPFCGAGSIGIACAITGRNYIGCDVNAEYIEAARSKLIARGFQDMFRFL